ncbi:MAG: DUF1800 domain-containing protein [Verrucomicrobiota bacterium]
MLKPLSADRWNDETAAHLLNRAGLGGPPAAIRKLADLGPDRAVSALLDYESISDPTPAPDWAQPNPDEIRQFRAAIKSASPDEKRTLQRERQRLYQQRMMELRGWWLQRMAKGPRSFQEKMVLFWHGHFATSVEKVRNPYFMWRQNEMFRRLATGNWLQLLTEAGKDPAMLVWLDQAQSRKQHPNENYAREVMELFSLGEGHYTELDVTEAARALTGWSLDLQEEKYVYRSFIHDSGDKTFLGRTGNLDGDDVMAAIVAQPQAAQFITAKLWNFFAGEPPSLELNVALAAVLRTNDNNFKPLLRVMFRCEEFYAPSVIRNQVKSPVQWLVGTSRMLECELPPAVVCWGLLRSLGQDLFAPPNVKGWDGGLAWITTNTLLARYNDAAVLVQGTKESLTADDFTRRPGGPGGEKIEKAVQRIHVGGVDPEKILTPDERANPDTLVAALEHRLLQCKFKGDQEKALRDFLGSKTKFNDADIQAAIRLVMATPQYQVT